LIDLDGVVAMNEFDLTRRQWMGWSGAALAASALPQIARAQAAWPSKAIRFVVPFAPGGSSEIVARSAAAEMSKLLGQSVYVDNRPGAAGNLAMGEVARADDQHTLILGHIGTLAVNPYIFDKLPYDPAKDFRPISLLAKVPSLYLVHPDLPVKNLKEFIALAKSKPGLLNYASSGPGTPYHMAGELFKHMTGTNIQHVPHKTSGDMRTSVLGGHVQMMFDAITVLAPNARDGKVLALGTTGKKRSTVMPEVPTVDEAGVPGYESTIWLGVMAPAKTPQPIVDLLNAEIRKIIARPEIQDAWGRQGAVPMTMTPSEFGAFLRDDISKWSKVVSAAGLVDK
jgi:tripartite-type tricarboxylate transporter receptor subunit TctC